MPRPMPVRSLIAALAAALLAGGCSDRPTAPDGGLPPITSLSVSGVRVNSADFRTNGTFRLGLIATAADSVPILNTGVSVAVALTSLSSGDPAAFAVTRDNTTVSQPGSADMRAAILLDDSGSMSSNDPTEFRSSAAELFWAAVLPVRAGNQVALLDFGAGATAPFTNSRLLQAFTADASLLATKLSAIGAFGGTPLYESLLETVDWMTTNTTASQNRVILLLTDGSPNSTTSRDAAIQAAVDASITVHTVGLGPASDQSPSVSTAALTAVREIADRTGGVYSAATTAPALEPIFAALARATSRGQLISTFRITPVPASGTRVSGTVTVGSGGTTGVASFSFVAP
ncbi:MAG: VWA domain-containing protein [Gemmatimonadaceae bacterium]|nr:VWA domain-containing protein [Gemmatimonadaceae bacterium]